MSTIQTIGNLSYNRPILAAVEVMPLNYRVEVVEATPAKMTLDYWVDLNPDSVRHKQEIAITAGTATDIYEIIVSIPGQTAYPCHYVMGAGNTAATIAAFFARVIDACPYVQAAVKTGTPGTIVVEAVTGGVEVTLTKSGSTVATNLTITEVTAESGEATIRKLARVEVKLNLSDSPGNVINNGIPQIWGKTVFYDGTTLNGANPIAQSDYALMFSHNTSIDTMQTAAGYERS